MNQIKSNVLKLTIKTKCLSKNFVCEEKKKLCEPEVLEQKVFKNAQK